MKGRRLLIVAPTFFPDRTVKAIRVSQWVKYLAQTGWKINILCRHQGYDYARDPQFGPNTEVTYLGSKRPVPLSRDENNSHYSVRRESRGRRLVLRFLKCISVPDVETWIWNSFTDQAVEIARRWKPDIVLSTSPPHSVHELARKIAKSQEVPWVVDFRDPYLIDSRYRPQGVGKLLYKSHEAVERRLYQESALAIHAIPVHARYSRMKHPQAADKIHILTNGFPDSLLSYMVMRQEKQQSEAVISIRSIGQIGNTAVSVMTKVVAILRTQGKPVEFRHTGPLPSAAVGDTISEYIQYRGLVSHEDAIREIANADVLLKFDDPQRSQAQLLSTKLFEYLAVGCPVLVVNPSRPDRNFLRGIRWASCTADSSPESVASAINTLLNEGTHASPDSLLMYRNRFKRSSQTKALNSLLTALLEQ